MAPHSSGPGRAWPGVVEQRMHAILEVVVVGIEIAVIRGREAVALRENLRDRESAGLGAARRVGRVVIHHAGIAVRQPRRRQRDARVGVHRLIALKVERQEHWHRNFGPGRQVQQQPHRRAIVAGREPQRHLTSNWRRRRARRRRSNRRSLAAGSARSASFRRPRARKVSSSSGRRRDVHRLCGRDLRAVRHDQRVRQRICAGPCPRRSCRAAAGRPERRQPSS